VWRRRTLECEERAEGERAGMRKRAKRGAVAAGAVADLGARGRHRRPPVLL
jgi:hypothetical protein